ncbi:MAG: tetratricopeptide repeat protein [Crocinitomicaceae bacterium]|nr:tetratricopeptide repeat protein [Crocinitomicaceae bacterium]
MKNFKQTVSKFQTTIKACTLLILMISAPAIALSQVSPDEKQQIDSLKQLIKTAKHDTTIIRAWMTWDNIIYYQDEDLDFALNKKIDSLCDINLDKKLTKKQRDFFLKSKAFAQNSFGMIFKMRGKLKSSMDSYLSGLEIYEKLNDQNGVSGVSTNIGNIHFDLENYDKALEYYETSLKIDTELENQYGIATCYNNIGLVYSEFGDYKLARENFNKTLKISKKIDNKLEESNCLNNLGLAHEKEKNFEEAIQFFELSLVICDSIGFINSSAGCYNNIGRTYIKMGDFGNALKSSNKGLALSLESEDNVMIRAAADNLYKVHKKQGNTQKALEMIELVNSSNEKLKTEDQKRQIAQQEFKFKLEQTRAQDSIVNAKEIEIKNSEIAANRAEANAQKQQNYYLFIGLALLALFGLFMFNRYKLISKQKNTIDEQKNAVELQKEKIEVQHHQLEETHQEISDSITYAERLQLAMLPSMDELNSTLKDGFVLFMPKNVVSGDFYWLHTDDDTTFIAVADCTGHGVPGAMVSVVCCNALNQAVREFGLKEPNEILNKTREIVIETFATNGGDVKDGMDIALCALKGDKVKFSGANNPLWIVRDNEFISEEQFAQRSTVKDESKSLIEYKSNKQPIGSFEDMKTFDQAEIQLYKNDKLYLFSDGFADQFGGPKGKKFMYKPFKRHLISIDNLSMMDQKIATEKAFNNWKGNEEQVDDVCIWGIVYS